MKKLQWFMAISIAFSVFACQQTVDQQSATEKIIEKPSITLTNDRVTPEVLWAFGRVSDVKVSPMLQHFYMVLPTIASKIIKGTANYTPLTLMAAA